MSQPVWTLIIQQGPHAGSAYPLHGLTMAIGRSADNQIVIDHPEISRHHARLSWQGNTYMLEDLGSANGTWVNGARITEPTPLRPGDSIGLGQGLSLTFSNRAQATSLAPYPSTFASPVVASTPAPARTNWKWVLAALGALIFVAAMAVVAVVILAPGKDDSSTPTSAGSDQGAVVVITATPSPTYTPMPTDPPTYTPYPTYTPVPTDPPTYTPYPTYTPVPTDLPTYTPYPTYTPVPTDPPTYTPYPTYTPFPTPRPQPTQPRPTDTPNPIRAPEAPYTIDINKIEPEPWGRPMNPDGCNKPYNDRDPVRRFTIEVILTNNSNRYVLDGWAPTFYTAKGQVPPTCIWWYDNTAVQPGEVTYVTFATHVESDDWVQAMVFDELGYEIMACFNAAAQVVACR